MTRHHDKRDRMKVRSHRRAERTSERRRGFLRSAIFLLLTALLGVLAYSIFLEPRMIKVTQHEVAIEDLPPAFDGFTIVQLTDLHVNNIWTKPKHIRRAVEIANAQHPDLTVLTGDYVSRFKTTIEPAGRALSGLQSRYGMYAVLGNHDYWTDAGRVTRALGRAGIDVLFDEQRRVSIGSESIRLVGMDDEWEGRPDYDKALAGIKPSDTCIVLAHNPDAILGMDGRPVDLVLTGHTHGGLINLPHFGPVLSVLRIGAKYSAGMFRFGDTRMYVCRGIGTGICAHIRFRCRPEVAVLTLRRAP